MKELGIYIHIPFCKQKCLYCDFISYQNKQHLIENYISALKEEIKKTNINNEMYKITTIYIGGGTPSFIDFKYIKEIITLIKEKYDIMESEITLEINPGTVNREKLKMYYEMGINRLSIGLQSTKDDLLKLIGRIHTYDDFIETYNTSRTVGFENVNVDLMIGLPAQTLQDVEDSLQKIIQLNPEHISVYSLILEDETPLSSKVKKGELFVPSEEIERKMYWLVKNTLKQAGYNHYEISNFAKKDKESKHNLNCWNQEEYIGFGAAAHSYKNKIRYSNIENIEKYIDNINNNLETKIIHEHQDDESQMKEYMLLGLRKIEGVKISEFKNKFIQNPICKYRNELKKLIEEKLLEIDKDNIKLTNRGIDLANLVWEEFI